MGGMRAPRELHSDTSVGFESTAGFPLKLNSKLLPLFVNGDLAKPETLVEWSIERQIAEGRQYEPICSAVFRPSDGCLKQRGSDAPTTIGWQYGQFSHVGAVVLI